MIKKIFGIIITIIILLPTYILAGDIPESIMAGGQKALFIGEIVALDESNSEIKPLTIMMGSVETETVTTTPITKYYGTNKKPKVGDFVIVILTSENTIDDQWIFKATTSDYKTLKLVSEKYSMVERYEEYINTGAYFEAQEKLNLKNIIPSEETNEEKSGTTEEKTEQALATNQKGKVRGNTVKIAILFIGIIGGILLIRLAKKNGSHF